MLELPDSFLVCKSCFTSGRGDWVASWTEGSLFESLPQLTCVVVSSRDDLNRINTSIKQVTVKEKRCVEIESISFSFLKSLEHIIIESGSLVSVRSVELQSLNMLQTVHIGDNVFRQTDIHDGNKNKFVVQDCPQLVELIIGSNTFVGNVDFVKILSIQSTELLTNRLEKLAEAADWRPVALEHEALRDPQ